MRWVPASTGDRRTDNLLVLLMIAHILPEAVQVAILLVRGEITLPAFSNPFLEAASNFNTLVGWCWEAWQWLAYGPGALVLLAVGVVALRRWISTGTAVTLVAVCEMAACATDAGLGLSALRGAVNRAGSGIFWFYVLQPLSSLALAPMPVIVLAFLWRHRGGSAPHAMPVAMARLTRAVLVANALVLILTAGGRNAIAIVLCWATTGRALVPQQTLACAASAPNLVWAVAVGVLALRLVRDGRLSFRVLRLAIAGDAVRWLVTVPLVFTWWLLSLGGPAGWFQGLQGMVGGATMVGRTVWIAVAVGWYWWPMIVRRNQLSLDPQQPACAHCGYSLIGNLSGRCPECGHPTPV
jgi:hypothetical protein